MTNSLPFEADTPKPIDRIAEAKLVLRKRFEQDRLAHKEQIHAEATAAYEARQRRERERWIEEWKQSNYEPLRYPYSGWADKDIYRVSLPHETRIDKLLEAEMYSTALKCWLYRRGSKAPLSAVKDFLRPYLGEVDGSEEIFTEHITEGQEIFSPVARSQTTYTTHKVVTCSGISKELKAVLHSLTVQGGVVIFATKSEILDRPGFVGERFTLAHNDEDYPTDEW